MTIKLQGINSFFTLVRSLVFVMLLLFDSTSTIKAQEVDDEKEFDYTKGSDIGPEKWGDLRPEWATCKKGKMQSPINLPRLKIQIIPAYKGIRRNYKPANAIVYNRGHDIMVQWEGNAGSVLINGTKFALQQIHWHTPSEHTIERKRYDMELHMVHRNSKGTIAVIAVLYKFGKPDPFLRRLKASISSLIDEEGEQVPAGVINPMKIQVCETLFYKYIGSLTTPPCTEGVIWIISAEVKTVSKHQVKLLREAVHDYAKNNARPLQPRNGRQVNLYWSLSKSSVIR